MQAKPLALLHTGGPCLLPALQQDLHNYTLQARLLHPAGTLLRPRLLLGALLLLGP
jgi:hypothetical protein